MQTQQRQHTLVIVFAAVLLSFAGIAGAFDEVTALTGTVVSVNRDLNYVTVRDDVTGRNFKIDTRGMNGRHSIDVWKLRAGDRLSATGRWENSDTYRADRVMAPSPLALHLMSNGMTGTVDGINRDLHYITVRNQATGRVVKVDVRGMDTNRSTDVWQLRRGDVITTQGSWAKNGNFRADFVNRNDTMPMASGYTSPHAVHGTVESVNRDLNYFTVRDEATGRPVKIDVRNMNTRRSVNVWNLRPGDRITVNGNWAKDGRFEAEMVNF